MTSPMLERTMRPIRRSEICRVREDIESGVSVKLKGRDTDCVEASELLEGIRSQMRMLVTMSGYVRCTWSCCWYRLRNATLYAA